MREIAPESIHFTLMFADEGMTVPIITTLKFSHSGALSDGTPCFFFEVISDEERENSTIFIRKQDAEDLLLSRQGLLKQLEASFSTSSD